MCIGYRMSETARTFTEFYYAPILHSLQLGQIVHRFLT
jgi:hypothetical protein